MVVEAIILIAFVLFVICVKMKVLWCLLKAIGGLMIGALVAMAGLFGTVVVKVFKNL